MFTAILYTILLYAAGLLVVEAIIAFTLDRSRPRWKRAMVGTAWFALVFHVLAIALLVLGTFTGVTSVHSWLPTPIATAALIGVYVVSFAVALTVGIRKARSQG